MRTILCAGLLIAGLLLPATAAAQVPPGYGPVPGGPPQVTTPPTTGETPPLGGAPSEEGLPPGDVAGEEESGGPGGNPPAGADQPGADQPATAEQEQGVVATAGSLPFTGLEVGMVLLAGIVLLAAGVLLRRTRTN